MPQLSGYIIATGDGGALVCQCGDTQYTSFDPQSGAEGDACTVSEEQQSEAE